MKFKQYINEEWAKSFKIDGETIEVFKNPPDYSEPGNHALYIRAILDGKGNLWVWDGNTTALHMDIARNMAFSFEKFHSIPLYIYLDSNLVEVSYWGKYRNFTRKEMDAHKVRVSNSEKIQKYLGTKEFKVGEEL